jgi:membrane protein YdbS with pleckstrin-like domain
MPSEALPEQFPHQNRQTSDWPQSPTPMLSELQEPEPHVVMAKRNTSDFSETTHCFDSHWWHPFNQCSLDAVTVGLTWQLVFVIQFCGRFPTLAESSIIGISIWLAYTADRILDARHLRPDLPHTSRHHFHHQFRRPLSMIWKLALIIDVILIASFASLNQIKWGMGCLFLVTFYVLGIQKSNWSIRRIPKELQAGCLFGFGISLVCWSADSETNLSPLFFSTLVAGFLFSVNCATVAYWERQLDAAQAFVSWTSRRNSTLIPIAVALMVEVVMTISLLFWQAIPPFIAACLLTSTVCLAMTILLITVLPEHREQTYHTCSSDTMSTKPQALTKPQTLTKPPTRREILADMSLIFPPTVLVILGAYHG